ncbi:hypothetical protein [Lysobacter sp. 22409]|uniref:hypothetical protein n=1 Tax=Lysobacter sp. 22409 TaxID=3453917 RepID=UPI003F846CA3
MSAPPRPQNPYELPANDRDARSFRESPWERNPQTQAWSRQVAVGYIGRPSTNPPRAWPQGEMVHVYRVGHANPDPAAHLASMRTADALSTPVEDRYRQVETTRDAL